MNQPTHAGRLTFTQFVPCEHQWGEAEQVPIWLEGKVIGHTTDALVRCVLCGAPQGSGVDRVVIWKEADAVATDPSTSLSEFLLARIAEDEELAQAVARDDADAHLKWLDTEWHSESGSEFGSIITPARVLAECAAKRAIIVGGPSECGGYERDPHGHYPGPQSYPCDGCSAAEAADAGWMTALRHLASVYADHPDFRAEWRG